MTPLVNDEPQSDVRAELKRLDRHITRHGESLSTTLERVLLMDARLKLLEEYSITRKIAEAREDERDKNLKDQLQRMQDEISALRTETRDEIKSIKGVGTKALWIVAGAVILAITTWALKGGLT
jgi:predicted flavoprotein YhiN